MKEILAWFEEHEFLTAAQIAGLGFSRDVVAHLVASGVLTHPLRGVYVKAADRRLEDLHALLAAAVLVDDPFVYAAGASALALLGAPLYNVPLVPVHVAEARTSSRIRQRVHRHVHQDGDATIVRDGLRLQEPALAAAFLAAMHGPGAGVVAMDWLLGQKLCEAEDLQRIVESGRVRRGLVSARFAVERADGRAQSPGESLLRGVLHRVGFPWQSQVPLGGPGVSYIVDFLVGDWVVVEFDGDVKYGGDQGHLELIHEKRREDWLRDQGFEVVRVVWRDLRDPGEVARRVHRAMVRARARHAAA